jgi:hypothetical protein
LITLAQEIFLFIPIRIWLLNSVFGNAVKKDVVKQFRQLVEDNDQSDDSSIKPYFDIYFPDMTATRLALLYPQLRVSKVILRDLLFVTNDPASLYLSNLIGKKESESSYFLNPSSSMNRFESMKWVGLLDDNKHAVAPQFLAGSEHEDREGLAADLASVSANSLLLVEDDSKSLGRVSNETTEPWKIRSDPPEKSWWKKMSLNGLLAVVGLTLNLPFGLDEAAMEVMVSIVMTALIFLAYMAFLLGLGPALAILITFGALFSLFGSWKVKRIQEKEKRDWESKKAAEEEKLTLLSLDTVRLLRKDEEKEKEEEPTSLLMIRREEQEMTL